MGKGARVKRLRREAVAEVIERKATGVHEVQLECPVTHRWVPTGLAMDAGSFGGSSMSDNVSSCPACGGEHRWGDTEVALAN